MINKDEKGLYFLIDCNKIYKFSEHFKVSEMFTTTHSEFKVVNYQNVPSYVILNLVRLCSVLEIIRSFLGDTTITINSGYRCSGLNTKVGGVYNSKHRFGLAADISIKPTEYFTNYLKQLKRLNILSEVIPYDNFYHISVPEYLSPNNIDIYGKN